MPELRSGVRATQPCSVVRRGHASVMLSCVNVEVIPWTRGICREPGASNAIPVLNQWLVHGALTSHVPDFSLQPLALHVDVLLTVSIRRNSLIPRPFQPPASSGVDTFAHYRGRALKHDRKQQTKINMKLPIRTCSRLSSTGPGYVLQQRFPARRHQPPLRKNQSMPLLLLTLDNAQARCITPDNE